MPLLLYHDSARPPVEGLPVARLLQGRRQTAVELQMAASAEERTGQQRMMSVQPATLLLVMQLVWTLLVTVHLQMA
jgi:hypothetical protein